jgi:hypothetical protein
MVPDRKLTPEEKEKIRGWQTAEILRRRGVDGPPSAGPGAGARPGPEDLPSGPSTDAIAYKCTKCGTPFVNRKYRRCFKCSPPSRRGHDTAESAAIVEAGPEGADPVAGVGNGVEVGGNGKPVLDVADHLRGAPEMIPPDPIAALRRVVDALTGLDADAMRWVLRSAARLPRPDPSEVT